MSTRYYNLKQDRKDVNGCVIVVNPGVSLDSTLEEGTLGNMSFNFLRHEGEKRIYEARSEPYYVPRAGTGISIGERSEKPILLSVSHNGILGIHKAPEGKRVYLSEVSEEQVKKIKEIAENWHTMQCWV